MQLLPDKIITSGVEEVEVAEPVGVKEEVLLDEKWSGADEEKCDQQAERRRGDRSLHYQAVGAERRNKGDRSEERQDKGEESIDPIVLTRVPFQLEDLRQSQAETSQSDDGEDDDAVVAEEGEDKGEREQTEEDVGQEVEGRLKPLEQGRLFISFACSDPVVTAALSRRHHIFAINSCKLFVMILLSLTLMMDIILAQMPTY